MPITIEPVRDSGLYEHSDGSVGRYTWVDGAPILRATYPDWSTTETYAEFLARQAQGQGN